MAAALLSREGMTIPHLNPALIPVFFGAAAMWLFTAGVALVFTLQSFRKDSVPRATVAATCAGIHVIGAMLIGGSGVMYLATALFVLALAAIAGSRSLLRLDPSH